MRLILTIFFIQIIIFLSQGQNVDIRTFIEYEDVIDEIKSTKSSSDIEFKYDYEWILLLDSTEISLIEKVDQQAINSFKESAPGLYLDENIIGFVTAKENIRELFESKELRKRIIDCTNTIDSQDFVDERIDFPIYIKGNLAIYSIHGPSWSATYFGSLKNGIFQFKELYSIIE